LKDGVHKTNGNDERELAPGVTKTGSACEGDKTCMAPMYFLDGNYLGGSYSNIAATPKNSGAKDDFGLEGPSKYEESFFVPRGQWVDRVSDYYRNHIFFMFPSQLCYLHISNLIIFLMIISLFCFEGSMVRQIKLG
jgi:ABC-type Na+ efflux pump permease subunit